MTNSVAPGSAILVACVLVAGCCTESKRSVTIAGLASYDSFQAGEIRLMLAESSSGRCSGSQTPGVQIAESTLPQPGPFTLEGSVCWTDSPPTLDLLAWYFENQSPPCQAGTYISLAPNSASDISLILKGGSCPARK